MINMYDMIMLILWNVNACLTLRGVTRPTGATCHTVGGEREHAATRGEREHACAVASAPVRPSAAEEEGSTQSRA
jgi:hypothetical protein